MKSKWEAGTRVRVRATVKDGTAGLTGVIEESAYAEVSAETSVLLDGEDFGAWFSDDELEAE